ncbi:hypothetical protein WME92_33015 [Sorangium sp. So ce307]
MDARLRAARNVARDAIVALVERAALREGRALRDVIEAIEAIEVVCRGGAQAKVASGGGSVPEQVTVQQFGELWSPGELARMYPDQVKPKRSVEQDVHRLDRHVDPIAGRVPVPVASFTLADAERVMRALPSISPASRRHIAQLLHRMMAKAVFPCRLLATNPLPRGFLPKLGPSKAKACLYPDEDARLLACTAILLCWRVFWGYLHERHERARASARRRACRSRMSISTAGCCASRRMRRTTPAPGRSPPASLQRCAPGSRSAATRLPPRRSS